jgi:hypothetical protein
VDVVSISVVAAPSTTEGLVMVAAAVDAVAEADAAVVVVAAVADAGSRFS